jgi:hypothetical protein
MRLQWIDSITDHLRFDSQRHILTIYRYRICLSSHLTSPASCSIPEAVLIEVLDTLNLLFPFADPATKQLLIKERRLPLYQLGLCGRDRNLNLSGYEFFREESLHLIDSFYQLLKTWKQLAMDRRNKLEWSAFWITVMVAFLTLVSAPCSIIQAVYTVRSYHATLP